MHIALAQMNTAVGDPAGNCRKMILWYEQARQVGADLLVFPELALCGYPPGERLRQKEFLVQCHQTLQHLAQTCPDLPMIVGWPDGTRGPLFNGAALLQAGEIAAIYHKGRLPAFHAFDETRYFDAGQELPIWCIQGLHIAPTICYDLWDIEWLKDRIATGTSLDLIVNLSASVLDEGKLIRRERTIRTAAQTLHCGVAYCNLVGQHQDLVFDGRSMVADATGQIRAQAAAFDQDLLVAELHLDPASGLQVKPR